MLPKTSRGPQTHSKYIGWHYMMSWRQSKKSQKMMISCDFPPFGPKRWKITKNHHFLRFFRLSSNHHIVSSNVFGMCLRTQRSFWKHLKWFLIDFERKIEKSSTNQKSRKIPKHRIFGKKFEFLNKPLNDSKWWYLAWNESSWCLRHVLKPYLPSEHA